MMHRNLHKESAMALRIGFRNANWWPLVQDEVKERIEVLLNNLEILGPPFRDAFVSHFKYENLMRMIRSQSSKLNQPGALFGAAMSEECYQCGKKATKSILDLDDWTEPNEADVQCCLSICNQVERIETLAEQQPTSVFESLITSQDDKTALN